MDIMDASAPNIQPIWCCPLQPFYLRYLVVYFWSKILFYFCACYICLRNNFLSKISRYLWYGRWEHTTANLSWWAWAPFFISNFHLLYEVYCVNFTLVKYTTCKYLITGILLSLQHKKTHAVPHFVIVLVLWRAHKYTKLPIHHIQQNIFGKTLNSNVHIQLILTCAIRLSASSTNLSWMKRDTRLLVIARKWTTVT